MNGPTWRSNLLAQEAECKSYLHELKLDFKKMLMLSRPYKCIEVDVVLVVLFVGSFFCLVVGFFGIRFLQIR